MNEEEISTPSATYKRHPLGEFLPPLTKAELSELEESVKSIGLTRPIIIYEDAILDGFYVYQFALKHGKHLRFKQFTNTTVSALDFRVSTVKGRSLTVGQKAALSLKYYAAIKNKAKIGGHNQYTPIDKLRGHNKNNIAIGVAAKKFDIGVGAISIARLVEKRDPETFEDLSNGKIALREAYRRVSPKDHSIHKKITYFDREARRVVEDIELLNYKSPPSIYATDHEIWLFDKFMKRKGYSLSLNRVGESFDAVYSKTSETINGHANYKAAIISAGKAVLDEIKVSA